MYLHFWKPRSMWSKPRFQRQNETRKSGESPVWTSANFPIYRTSFVNRISEPLLPLIMKLWISETSVIIWGNPIDPVYRPATRFGVPFFVKIDNKRVHSSPFLISRFVFESVTSLPQVVITVLSDFHGYCWSTHFKHLVFIPLEFAWFHNIMYFFVVFVDIVGLIITSRCFIINIVAIPLVEVSPLFDTNTLPSFRKVLSPGTGGGGNCV